MYAAARQTRPASPLALAARVAGALLVLTAGAMHLWLYFDFFHRIHVVGVLFLLNAAGAALVGMTLLVSAHPVGPALGIAFSAGTLAGFFVSVYHGLFGYVEALRGPWQEAAGGVEVAAIVVLLPLFAATLANRGYGLRRRGTRPGGLTYKEER